MVFLAQHWTPSSTQHSASFYSSSTVGRGRQVAGGLPGLRARHLRRSAGGAVRSCRGLHHHSTNPCTPRRSSAQHQPCEAMHLGRVGRNGLSEQRAFGNIQRQGWLLLLLPLLLSACWEGLGRSRLWFAGAVLPHAITATTLHRCYLTSALLSPRHSDSATVNWQLAACGAKDTNRQIKLRKNS